MSACRHVGGSAGLPSPANPRHVLSALGCAATLGMSLHTFTTLRLARARRFVLGELTACDIYERLPEVSAVSMTRAEASGLRRHHVETRRASPSCLPACNNGSVRRRRHRDDMTNTTTH
jgi:hypothetical protein